MHAILFPWFSKVPFSIIIQRKTCGDKVKIYRSARVVEDYELPRSRDSAFSENGFLI